MSSILGAISNVVPTGVISSIMKLADFITNLFCSFEGKFILGQLQSAMGDISDSPKKDIAGKVVDKVVGGFSEKVTDTVNGVLSKIQNGISKVSSVANTITSAIGVAQKAAGVACKVSGSLNTLFEFDFSKLDFASIVSIIMGILAALFGNKDCGRSIKQPKQKFWLPLLGTSTCESVPEFLMQEVTLYGGGSVGKPKPKSKGDYFKSLMKDIDVYAVKAETFLNGAKTIQDNPRKRENYCTAQVVKL